MIRAAGALAALLVLSGCAALPILAGAAGLGALSGAGTYAAIEAGIKIADEAIQVGCATYTGARLATEVEIASGRLSPERITKARAIEEYGDPVCAAPPSSDVSTAIWLGTLVGELGSLAVHRIEEAQKSTSPSAPAPISWSLNPSLDGK